MCRPQLAVSYTAWRTPESLLAKEADQHWPLSCSGLKLCKFKQAVRQMQWSFSFSAQWQHVFSQISSPPLPQAPLPNHTRATCLSVFSNNLANGKAARDASSGVKKLSSCSLSWQGNEKWQLPNLFCRKALSLGICSPRLLQTPLFLVMTGNYGTAKGKAEGGLA